MEGDERDARRKENGMRGKGQVARRREKEREEEKKRG